MARKSKDEELRTVSANEFRSYLLKKLDLFEGSQNALAFASGLSNKKVDAFIRCVKRDTDIPLTEVDVDVVDETAIALGDHLMDACPSLYAY